MYESEATKFIKSLLAQDPGLVDLQRRNRATWWDRPQDLETRKELDSCEVRASSYAYFPRPDEK